MDLIQNVIYCTYENKNVEVEKCMICNNFYECDLNWCNNHKCKNCENKAMGLCRSEL